MRLSWLSSMIPIRHSWGYHWMSIFPFSQVRFHRNSIPQREHGLSYLPLLRCLSFLLGISFHFYFLNLHRMEVVQDISTAIPNSCLSLNLTLPSLQYYIEVFEWDSYFLSLLILLLPLPLQFLSLLAILSRMPQDFWLIIRSRIS